MRSESSQIAEAVDGLGVARDALLEQRCEGEVVAVDTAEDDHPLERPLDLDAVRRPGEELGAGVASLPVVEDPPRLSSRLAEALQRDEVVTPRGEAAVGGQIAYSGRLLLHVRHETP